MMDLFLEVVLLQQLFERFAEHEPGFDLTFAQSIQCR